MKRVHDKDITILKVEHETRLNEMEMEKEYVDFQLHVYQEENPLPLSKMKEEDTEVNQKL